MAESTRAETRRVLLKGCKTHKSQRVAIKRLDLGHAIGEGPAEDWIRKAGKFKGPTILVSFNRLKLIHILEKSDIVPED